MLYLLVMSDVLTPKMILSFLGDSRLDMKKFAIFSAFFFPQKVNQLMFI